MSTTISTATTARIQELVALLRETSPTILRDAIPDFMPLGCRIQYVPVSRRAIRTTRVSRRPKEILQWIDEHPGTPATSQALQMALRVNRNVISGAVYYLRTRNILRSEPLAA